MNNRWNLKGKKAFITGGSKGIGLGIVKEFLELGAEVFTIARNKETLNKVISEFNMSYKITGIVADASKSEDRLKVFKEIEQHWGKLDILINNVGINIRKKILDYNEEEYNRIMSTNLSSAFYFSQLAHPLLKKSPQGNIVNISSVAGQTHLKTGAIYGMTKAALIQLTKNLANEWAEDNIRVNAVAPWYIKTPLVEPVLSNKTLYNEIINRTPMKKIGNTEDVAATVAFLCMPGSTFTTGQCISIDGGFTTYGF